MSTYDSIEKIWKGPTDPYQYSRDVYFGEELIKVLCKSPESVMFISHEENYSMTRGEARELSINMAKNLMKFGIKPDDVVGVICRNSKYLPVLLYGCVIIGAPINPLDVSFMKSDIKHMFKLTGPKIVFCDHDVYQTTREVLNELNNDAKVFTLLGKIPGVAFVEEMLEPSEDKEAFIPPRFKQPSDQKILGIICTSGTTGLVKGCSVSHAYFFTLINYNYSDTITPSLTFYFTSIYWMSAFYSSICIPFRPNEAKLQSQKRFNAELLGDLINKYKINYIFLPPSHLYMFLQSQSSDNVDLSSIKLVLAGGSMCTKELFKLFHRKFPFTSINNGYGMTECLAITRQPGKVYKNDMSTGNVRENYVVKIVDEDSNKLGVGEEGEVMIKSSVPFMGYYNDPESTNSALDAEGFLKSGDIGFFDDDESLSIVDRRKDILKVKMFHVNPSEIEELIMSIDGVVQVAVIGIPDPEFQHLAKAVVVKKKGFESLTEQAITNFVAGRLPSYKHLHAGVVFMQALPMTASGKVRKRVLVEQFVK